MKSRVERCILVGIAGVSAAAPLVLDTVSAGLVIAALNLALALCDDGAER